MTDTEDYEREWADIDEKVILAQILAELQQIRVVLSDAQHGDGGDTNDTPTYECVKCGKTVPGDEREGHARREHKAPPGLGEALFETVE